MESKSNNRKSKGLLYRLTHLKIRKQSHDEDLDVSLRRHPENDRNESNIRRSLRKMHTRIQNCVSKQKNRRLNNIHTFQSAPDAPTASHSHSRITLGLSPRTHVENFYSVGPSQSSNLNTVDLPSPIHPSPIHPSPIHNSSNRTVAPPLPPRMQSPLNPKNDVVILSQCYWYWGPVSRSEVERRLATEPDGSFLIRDSTSDRYIFSLSFRSVGRTLHTRIEHDRNGYFLFDQTCRSGYNSIKELVENAIEISKNEIFCYTKNLELPIPNFPVRLIKPISRYSEVKSLKHLTRFVIRQVINLNNVEQLPLPETVIKYLQEETIF